MTEHTSDSTASLGAASLEMRYGDSAASLEMRYGDSPARPQSMSMNHTLSTLLAHKSVRAFTPEPVADADFTAIVAAAQSASTSSNQHLWTLVAVDDPATKAALADCTRSERAGTRMDFLEKAPLVLVWVADVSRNRRIVEDAGDGTDTYTHLDAFLMASVDAALAAQNAAVAAESLGLGICYIGALRNHAEEAARVLGLPHMAYPVFGMVLGHPDPARETLVRPRPQQDVVLHRNRYTAPASDEWINDYEDVTTAFRTASGMSGKSWRDAVRAAARPEYMDGREQLGTYVRRQGFGLE